MELEFDSRELGYLRTHLREPRNAEQTQELRLSDGMPDVGKILGTWGQVVFRSKEWRGDTVSFSGGVMAWVLYAPEDGSEPRMLETWIPFHVKWELDAGVREGDIRIQCLLRFLDARTVSARKVMLRCGIGALGEAFSRDTARLGVPGKLPEDVQLLTMRYPMRLPKASGEKTFTLDEELTLPASAPMPERLVSYTLEPRLNDAKGMGNKVVFRGGAVLHLVYLSDEGRVTSRDLELPISQFAELEGEFTPDAQPDIRMGVTSLEVELDPENHLRLKCGLLAQYVVDDREILELVEDAYSPLRSVEPVMEELMLPALLEQKQVPVAAHQTLRLDAGEIADVIFLPELPRAHRGEGTEIELPGQFQVLYYDPQGNLQGATARTEEQWQMPSDEGVRVDAAILPGSQPAASVGEGISLSAENILQLTFTSRRGIPMVTGLAVGEMKEKDPNRPSVILRRAGDAGLWEIAKTTGSTVEAIRQANALESEPAANQILLIPVG